MHWLNGAPAHVTRFGQRQTPDVNNVYAFHRMVGEKPEESTQVMSMSYSKVFSDGDKLLNFLNSGIGDTRLCVSAFLSSSFQRRNDGISEWRLFPCDMRQTVTTLMCDISSSGQRKTNGFVAVLIDNLQVPLPMLALGCENDDSVTASRGIYNCLDKKLLFAPSIRSKFLYLKIDRLLRNWGTRLCISDTHMVDLCIIQVRMKSTNTSLANVNVSIASGTIHSNAKHSILAKTYPENLWRFAQIQNQHVMSRIFTKHDTAAITGLNNSTDLPHRVCPLNQYQCGDEHCIWTGLVLDGIDHCPDGTDENELSISGFQHEAKLTKKLTAAFLYFHCHNDEYILWYKVCNGIHDCVNGTDETICLASNHLDSLQTVSKTEDVKSSRCFKSNIYLPSELFNDNIPDCVFVKGGDIIYEDEFRPKAWLHPISDGDSVLYGSEQYEVDQSHCQFDLGVSGHVVPYRDGRHLRLCAPVGCKSSQYKCPESYCISIVRLCDGVRDCPYGEDEASCPPEGKPLLCPGMFKCKNGQCIHQDQVCDGKLDCPTEGNDEMVCDTPACPQECRCLLKSMMCILQHHKTLNGSTFRHIYVLSSAIPIIYDGDTVAVYNFSTGWLTKVQPHSFNGVPNIVMIDLSYNSLRTIHSYGFSNLHKLSRLVLVGNKLSVIENYGFHQLYQLENLIMNQMELKIIYGNAFSHLTNLKVLDLSENKISDINMVFLENSPGLRLLNVTNNVLSYIRNLSVISKNVTVHTKVGYICCHAECVSDANTTLDCAEMDPGYLFTCLAAILACSSVSINIWNIRLKRSRAFSVAGALKQSAIANILLNCHLLVLALKHVLIPEYYIGLWRGRICVALATLQFIALAALPWFSTVHMHAMFSRMKTVIAKPWITITNVIVVWSLSIIIGIVIVTLLYTINFSNPEISEHCSFLSQYPNINLFGRLVLCCLTLGFIISLLFSVYFCLRIRKLVKASNAMFNTLDSSRFNTGKSSYTDVFKVVVLLHAIVYLPVVGVSIAIISGYTVPFTAHLIFHITAVPILSSTISINTILKYLIRQMKLKLHLSK